ncbi:MAG: protein translocase subunit SecD [Verrucomicrobiales bacterium]
MHPALAILFFSLSLAVLLFWYFATDGDRTRRWVGTFLSIGVTIFCLLGIFPPKNIPGLITGKIPLAEAHNLQPGIDIAGGSSFVLKVQLPPDKSAGPALIQQAIATIRKRLDSLGSKDIQMGPQGDDKILLQMPGVKEGDRESIRQQLEKAAQLNFHLVHPNSDALVAGVKAGGFEPGYELKTIANKDKLGNKIGEEDVLITVRPDLAGTFVNSASPMDDPTQGWIVSLVFNADGRSAFGELTRQHVGERLAVVLDGEVVSAPRINEPILAGTAQISGMGGSRASMELSSALMNPLAAPLSIEDERSVSATLGADAVKQGILSGVVGMAITIVFLLFYYRLAGLVAFIGLMVNMIVLFGVMAMFSFTFTLPGIAGVLLTIGMAVDSNVLIYERLKEELAAGKSAGNAITAAYDKAFSAIFDANITTLLSGAVLFYLATDAIRGFAVSLVCGIIGTMFAALLVTRTCFRWMIDTGWLKAISIGKPLRNMNINFMKRVRACGMFTIVFTIICFGIMAFKGNDALGVSFKGGDLLTIRLTPETMISVAEVEGHIKNVPMSKAASVQEMATPGTSEALLSIKVENKKGPEVLKYLRENVPQFQAKDAQGIYIAKESIDSVGPTMGKELFLSSGWALALGVLAILIYLTLRFEFPFAIGTIVAMVHDLVVTVGVMIAIGREIDAVMVGALLTIAGYSVNDTIVIFDRIRETIRMREGAPITEIMNEAINATLSRTLLTSLTTLFILTFMTIWGGPSLRDFSLSLIIGIIFGTYSSIYVASAFVVWWTRLTGKSLHQEVAEAEARATPEGV